MSELIPSNIIDLTERLLISSSKKVEIALDLTLGNGNDAHRILKHFPDARLLGFDIQEIAIENSRKKLSEFESNRYKLICDCHSNLDQYTEKADLVIYNLGYMPGGNKSIISQAKTTLESLEKASKILSLNGLIIMVFYLGHKGGIEEYKICKEYLSGLNQKEFTVLESYNINQVNNPPRLICIERKI